MRVLLIGATGTIGKAVAAALKPEHTVMGISRGTKPVAVDLADPVSIQRMFRTVGTADAIVCMAGQPRFAPLAELSEGDLAAAAAEKLLGQVYLTRHAFGWLTEGGSVTLTGGLNSRFPSAGASAAAMVNAGLEGFVRSAALDAPRGIRVNVVAPPWVKETMEALGMDPAGGVAAAALAEVYVGSVTGSATGQVLEAPSI